MAFETKEVLAMLKSTQNNSKNKMTVKMPVLILTSREWENKEHQKMYTYTSFSESADGVIEFNSSRLLPKGKPAEVLLTLTGFRAFEALR